MEFTKEEAEYGVNETQTNWNDQAIKIAEGYLDNSLLQSKKELVNYLQGEGFIAKEIAYAVSLIFKDEEEELEVEEPNVTIPQVLFLKDRLLSDR